MPARSGMPLLDARAMFFDQGDLPPQAVPELVERSWKRCVSRGISPGDRFEAGPEGRVRLDDARMRAEDLLHHGSLVMRHLYEQIRHSGSLILLSDPNGMILHAIGDADFTDRAARVSLQPGANWGETSRGTNAIGTALVEGCPVEVLGGEHFLERNQALRCAAVPVFAPGGQIAGVIDISSRFNGSDQPHTLAVVQLAAQQVERRLFESRFERCCVLGLHAEAMGLGSMSEGLLAFDGGGRLLAVSHLAESFLPGSVVPGATVEAVLSHRWDRLQDALAQAGVHGLEVRLGDRSRAWVRLIRQPRDRWGSRQPVSPTVSARVVDAQPTLSRLDTGDAAMKRAISRASRIAGRHIALLIQGEPGVGKEVFARAFHQQGERSKRPFVVIDCAATPAERIESALFGDGGGAFAGAHPEGMAGKLRQAHGGTLFIDEIGDLPLVLQARLLRVLQDRAIMPLDGKDGQPVDFDLICATHGQLLDAVHAGTFRNDLFYCLNGLTVHLPPLRRRSDLAALVDRMLAAESRELGTPVALHPLVLDFFHSYHWPGNLRQLQNVLRVAVAMLGGGEHIICGHHLPDELFSDAGATFANSILSGYADDHPGPQDAAHGGVGAAGIKASLAGQTHAVLRKPERTHAGDRLAATTSLRIRPGMGRRGSDRPT